MNLHNDDNMCRICLKRQETLFSLYRNLHGASPYQKLISKTNLRIELNDAGPSSICSQCLIDLDTTISFLERCEQSNRAFAAMVEQVEHKNHNTLCSNKKSACSTKFEDETWVELEPTTRDGPPTAPTNPRLAKNDRGEAAKVSSMLLEEHKCPECGSKRRCVHWTPPTSFLCQYCDKLFNKKYNYQIHLKRHLGERNCLCPTCGAAQLTASLAARHCRPKPRRLCPAPGCGKAFTTNSNLHIHMRTHSGERPFECHDCSKRFTSKKTLKDHVRIHTGEKPYMCPVCGARFTSNHMSAHMRSHARAGCARRRAPGPGAARSPARRRTPGPGAARSPARRRTPGPGAARSPARAFACALCACAYKFKQSLNRHVRKRHGVSARLQSPSRTVETVPPGC